MIIRYFAWLKDITNVDEEVINDPSIKDIESLKLILMKKYPKLQNYFNKDNMIRVAINLEYKMENETISKGDEIALFPPVSGG
tara:strand:- start:47 stop:295 length:249 start_codon:yes stop_codon:yes gene_type:complete